MCLNNVTCLDKISVIQHLVPLVAASVAMAALPAAGGSRGQR
jgi:hypothetical protein